MSETGYAQKYNYPFMQGGGEMGELTRTYNWDDNALGDPGLWPQSLKTTLSIILNSKFPMFLWWGPELICFYNDAYRPSLGNEGKHPSILGMPAKEAWPEIWDTIQPLMAQVLAGGEATWSEDQLIPIYRNGHIEDVYWTFSYSPVTYESGAIMGVLVTCTETTGQVLTRLKLEEKNRELELAVEAELLAQRKIRENERNLRQIILQAPVAIAIFREGEYIVEIANSRALELWDRQFHEVQNKPVMEAIPELRSQGIQELLDNVYKTGEPFVGTEVPVQLFRNGQIETAYINFVYEPLYDTDGKINGLITIGSEVTEQVQSKMELQRAYEQARLSKEAAQLGTFDMDLVKGTMDWDARCRILFGISHNEEVSYEKDFVNGLHPDDREHILEVIENAFIRSVSNGDYDVEYRTIGAEDNRLRWVRAKGKVYFDAHDKPVRFIGSVLDITEQKQDEQRKNDFIGMVSHELKTPLTTLTAIVQVLNPKLKTSEDPFIAGALDKANIQVKKMSGMINGFLNISRLESGKIVVDKQYFELGELIREMIGETALTLTSHTINFSPCPAIMVKADREKIGSVVSNLLSNAVKYSPKGKFVEVNCEVDDNIARVSIKDEGIGIKQQHIDKLFDRYYRVDNKNMAHISGFGIGLYLSAEIIERHNGKIWAESDGVNGSIFYFTLPLS